MTGRDRHRYLRLVGWLLTPLVAWAVSFGGGWLAALGAPEWPAPWGGVLWLVVGAVTGAVTGAVGWIALLRRLAPPPEPPGQDDGARQH